MDAKIISLEQALADAVQLAKDFGVGKLYLIGSAATLPWDKLNDLDFAIDEIFPGKFFKFYGALLKSMPKP
ncbi:MAG TPA: hypothetical protein DF383_09240, partial [Deltaproteobacteria bacterium]|nr:hypothetical protein [Deltaproteobacteria bacterium]